MLLPSLGYSEDEENRNPGSSETVEQFYHTTRRYIAIDFRA
jgi:hypothetical protein